MTIDETSRKHLDQLSMSLGRVVISFARLEHDITMTIADVMGLDETQERALVRPLQISSKTALLLRLSKHFIPRKPPRERIRKTLEQIDDAADQRNDLVHGLYGHKGGKVTIISFAGGARLTGKPTYWGPRELELFVVGLRHLRSELDHLRTLFPKRRP